MRLKSKALEGIESEQRPTMGRLWGPRDENRVAEVEKDTRNLLRKLSESSFALSEQEKRGHQEVKQMLLSILDVLDAFERVFRNAEAKKDQMTDQMKKWITSFRTVYRMLKQMLADKNVTRIENLDQGFDPHWHTIAETVVDASKPEGAIVEELKTGYVWQNALLRKTEVICVKNVGDAGSAINPN